MSRLTIAMFCCTVALGATAACSTMSVEMASAGWDGMYEDDSSDNSVSAGSSGSGGHTNIETNFGDGGSSEGLSYTLLCGGGCTPTTANTPSTPAADNCEPSSGSGGGSPAPSEAVCRLTVDPLGEVNGSCSAGIGSLQNGDPCLHGSDCANGLGCVAPGVCRPYCCGDLEACPTNSYCAPTAITTGDMPSGLEAASVPKIPACAPVSPCTLFDDENWCAEGQTCTIVRVDGTTSCIEPGSGKSNDPCPCAAGFVCATGQNACQQLCAVDDSAHGCEEGYTCQGGSGAYPGGFGVCVAN